MPSDVGKDRISGAGRLDISRCVFDVERAEEGLGVTELDAVPEVVVVKFKAVMVFSSWRAS